METSHNETFVQKNKLCQQNKTRTLVDKCQQKTWHAFQYEAIFLAKFHQQKKVESPQIGSFELMVLFIYRPDYESAWFFSHLKTKPGFTVKKTPKKIMFHFN